MFQYIQNKPESYSWFNMLSMPTIILYEPLFPDTDSSGESEVFINNANHGFVTQLCCAKLVPTVTLRLQNHCWNFMAQYFF